MKKILALALAIVSVLIVAAPAMAATVGVPVVMVALDQGSVGPTAPCIYKSMSTSSTIVKNLSGVSSVQIKFTSGNLNWPEAKSGTAQGYIQFKWLEFTNASLVKALFSNTAFARGDKGMAIENLQRCLVMAGYNTNGIDGIFGAGTESAVKKLQSWAGLPQDGVADKDTKYALLLKIGKLPNP